MHRRSIPAKGHPAAYGEQVTDTRRESSPVPLGVRAASEWSWRFLLIAAALFVAGLALSAVSQVVVPVAVALLMAALLAPLSARLSSSMPKAAAAALTLIATIIIVGGLLTVVGTQFTKGFGELTGQLATGVEQIRDWVRGTFHITDNQFDSYWEELTTQIGKSGNLGSTAATVGLTAGHFLAGMFIALFTLFFFLYDGPGIWRWIVRLFPRAARDQVRTSGWIAWEQLSAFVRATIIVALVDAVGISAGAAILKVPFALAIGVLVFLLSFIPIVGALVSGSVAVLLALVAHGPGIALVMLAVVLGVQQLEAHVLQPLLLGKAVHVHPLAVILAIAAGSIIAGIVGALVAVPLAAVLNAVGKHLLEGESEEQLEVELETAAAQGESPAHP